MSYKTTVLADNPTDLWMLDEAGGAGSAADSGTGGVTLTATSVTFGSSALATNISKSASFNGSTSQLSGGTFASRAAPAPAYGVEAWIKTNSATTQVIWSGEATTGNGVTFYVNGTAGGTLAVVDQQIDSSGYLGSTSVVTNAATHVALIWDGTKFTFYVNGVQDVQRTPASSSIAGASGVYGVGWQNNTGGHGNFNGNLAAVAYYVGANQLTATMVSNHYLAGTTNPSFSSGGAVAALLALDILR